MPMDRSRYPADWQRISERRRRLSGGRCECRGECGHSHGLAFDHCDEDIHDCNGCDGTGHGDCGAVMRAARCEARHAEPHPVTGSQVVLTVAHLDHDTSHNDDDNLRAMCQRCHLAYDAELHQRNARATRRRRRALADLFAGTADPNLDPAWPQSSN